MSGKRRQIGTERKREDEKEGGKKNLRMTEKKIGIDKERVKEKNRVTHNVREKERLSTREGCRENRDKENLRVTKKRETKKT